MSKINSKQKGARFEREVAAWLREHGYEARRAQQYCGAAGDSDVLSSLPLHIECKHVEKLNVYQAMQQAIDDSAPTGQLPVVIHKRNRSEKLVTMRADDWIALVIGWEQSVKGVAKSEGKINDAA